MTQTFLISDTHFDHSNILTFNRKDGTPLRPGFRDIHDMNEQLIQNWNKVVNTNDKVYHLGDVGFFKETRLDQIVSRLNGDKVLIKGNHDDRIKAHRYLEHFRDIRAYHVLDKLLLAHIPIHFDSVKRWKGQVHGHTHDTNLIERIYYNVSVENINYTPINFEVIREYYKQISS